MSVKVFELEDGRQYLAPARSCFFCEHCTDVFFDHGGPYMLCCELSADEKYADLSANMGLGCDAFEEDDDETDI